jgi:PKD repeat protein
MKRFSMVFVMMAFQAWLFMPGLFSQNLLNNGSFETGQTGWTGWSSALTVTTANPQEGNHSARFTAGNTLEQSGIVLDTGQQYKLSFWLRINGMVGNDWGGIRIAVISMDWSEWHISDFFTVNNRPTGQWFNEVVSFHPTVSPVRVQVQFFGGGGWTSHDFQIDNMVLFEDIPVNSPPVIHSFSVTPVTGTVPFTVTGSVVATDPDGVVQNYLFDMGDGAVFSGSSTFQHTYRIQGEYDILVTVADDEGASSYDTVQIIAQGSNPHQVQVTHPPGEVYLTTFDTVNIQGIRQHGAGDIFWVNHRTGQSGFVPVVSNQFTISNLSLIPGNNQIHIQSANGLGQYLMTTMEVLYQPVGYSGPVISNITANNTQVTQYERTDIHFEIATVADNLSFPYDPSMPANLQTGSGISVDMVFTKGAVSLTQPAFLDMGYTRSGDVLVPSGEKRWTVRMAFADTGVWSSQILARDTMGITTFAGPLFTVLPDQDHDGYLRVSQSDNRYLSTKVASHLSRLVMAPRLLPPM